MEVSVSSIHFNADSDEEDGQHMNGVAVRGARTDSAAIAKKPNFNVLFTPPAPYSPRVRSLSRTRRAGVARSGPAAILEFKLWSGGSRGPLLVVS